MILKTIELRLPPGYQEQELLDRIQKLTGTSDFSWQIDSKSLDARKKRNIFWLLKIIVSIPAQRTGKQAQRVSLEMPFKKRNKKVLITGSGPAGFFAAFVLQSSGFETVIVERGTDVDKRSAGIRNFEKTGEFDPAANYSFGEGGAGTFSDGKLTSRSKHISAEREFFLRQYIDAGAPAEINYLTHPHVGSDNLKLIVRNLREKYLNIGGEIRFGNIMTGLASSDGNVNEAIVGTDSVIADYFVIAPGNSSYETYRMLMESGVHFRTKGFALGCRTEHNQREVNLMQWGVEAIPGVKAAEYRLATKVEGNHPVYTFCMCPGGMVVPAASHKHLNIVNGMSLYDRAGEFSNAACVAGIHPDELAGRRLSPSEALDWLESLEASFFDFSNGYSAPFCSIKDFFKGKLPDKEPSTSYPLGLKPAPLWEMLPQSVTKALRAGLGEFSGKLKGFDEGILLGLESKTSSPIQVIRAENGLCCGFTNLFLAGEGSGYAGGIVSSAADGIKIAMNIIRKESQ